MKAAFLVGVSKYDSLQNLSACAGDVSMMESLLSATKNYERIEFLKENTNSDAVKSALRNFVKELLEQEQSVEELFFYFSGHGTQNHDEVFLCCSDFSDKRPESTSLLNSELDGLIRSINPKLTVKIFDACQSGYQYIKDTNIFTKRVLEKSGIENFIFMASCSPHENSFADKNISFFTKAFFEGAVSKEKGDDIYYRDIQSHIADNFKSYSGQTPLFVNQTNGLDIFGTVNDSLKSLKVDREQLNNLKTKDKPLIVRVRETIDDIELDYLPKEKIDILFQEIEPSKLNINLSQEINNEFYTVESIDSIPLKDINSAKLIAKKVASRKWSNDCFITIEKEAYKSRQLRSDLPWIETMNISMGYLGGRFKNKKIDDSYYENVTKYRPSNIKVNFQIPFDCLRLEIKPSKLCLHPWQSFLFILPARNYCGLIMGFSKLERHSWDAFRLNPSEIKWIFKELLWRNWSKNPPIQTLVIEMEKRIRQDILQTSGIIVEDEYEIDEEEEAD